MNLIDLLGIGSLLLMGYGLLQQLRALITAMNLSEEVRMRTYRDLRPFTGFALVLLGWFLSLVVVGAASMATDRAYLFVAAAIANMGKLAVAASGVLLAIEFLVFGARMVAK